MEVPRPFLCSATDDAVPSIGLAIDAVDIMTFVAFSGVQWEQTDEDKMEVNFAYSKDRYETQSV